ncbi:MAG: outer membrane protein assembly factor BamD [Deltaproteobacteria bacterium]|nr:outer membrane protein assembly factor BamD [Deltaproteobacteria bacterium]
MRTSQPVAGPKAPLLALLLLLGAAACASGPKITPTPGTAGYDQAAEALYESARKALDSSDYLHAASRFQEVRAKFPYTKYGPLAELGLADTAFAEGKYLEAVDGYRAFVRARPTHEEADYASYRIVQALAKEAPSDFFLFPPSHEKDLAEVRQAVASADRFLSAYPESEYRKDGEELRTSLRRRLADHELYVAGFYRRKGKWNGVATRLERLLQDFPGVGLDSQARVALAEAYLEVEPPRLEEARAQLEQAGELAEEPGLAAKAKQLRYRIENPPAAEPAKEEAPEESEAPVTPAGEAVDVDVDVHVDGEDPGAGE